MFKKKYRIVTDAYGGFEVQSRRLWFWTQVGFFCNTYPSLAKAKEAVDEYRNPKKYGCPVWTEGEDND